MQARYYDPVIGQFISPDTIVPDPTNVYAYNRYMYAYGNPLRYTDPTGHQASCTMDQNLNWSCNSSAIIGGQTLVLDPNKTSAEALATTGFTGDQLSALTQIAQSLSGFEVYYQEDGSVDWQATMETNMVGRQEFEACGELVGGVCGISFGGSAAVFALGVKASVDGAVDSSGNMAAYLTVGGGGYAVFSGVAASGHGPALFAIRNATVDDLQGWSVQGGGQHTVAFGYAFDVLVGKNSEGEPWTGLLVSTPFNFQSGYGSEIHATATYSWQIYRSSRIREP